jgi:hypothetical protein
MCSTAFTWTKNCHPKSGKRTITMPSNQSPDKSELVNLHYKSLAESDLPQHWQDRLSAQIARIEHIAAAAITEEAGNLRHQIGLYATQMYQEYPLSQIVKDQQRLGAKMDRILEMLDEMIHGDPQPNQTLIDLVKRVELLENRVNGMWKKR